MKFLLVMPRIAHSPGTPYAFLLGIAYISASLKHAGYDVHTLNLNLSSSAIEDAVADAITRNAIDVVCVGGQSLDYAQIKGILSLAKSLNPSIRTIIGGGLVTAAPEVVMKSMQHADIGVIHEGEESIVEIAAALESGSGLGAIAGIIHNENGRIARTGTRRDILDLDAIPFPDYEGFGFAPRVNCGVICASRSCPFDCSFCFHTSGRTYRRRSLDNVFAEIDYLVEKYRISFLSIVDELFSLDKSRMEEFCERIAPYRLRWTCQMRVDGMDGGILEKARRSSCNVLSIGIESASDRVLRSMNKKITVAQIEQAIETAKKAGVNLLGNLLFGDKEDDMESAHDDLRWLDAHPDLNIGFFHTMVLPGSNLYKHAVDTGRIADEVDYLEKGNYTINVTRLDDGEYGKCLDVIDQAVLRREYSAKAIRLESLDKNIKRAVVSCECPSCGKRLRHHVGDFFGLENFCCGACGQSYNINLFRITGDAVLKKVRDALRGEKIVVWGMGTVGKKFLYFCEPAFNENLFLVDRNPVVQGKTYGGRVVAALESIACDISRLLFGTSLMGKTGAAIPNVVSNAAIRKAALSLPVNIGSMSDINTFIFDALLEADAWKNSTCSQGKH